MEPGALITRTAGVRGGRPCLAGTGITVRQVAMLLDAGQSAAEIQALIPHTTLAQVEAAAAYAREHREELEADRAAEMAAFLEGQRAQEQRGLRDSQGESRAENR